MNREQKGAAIAEIAAQIKEAQAILAVDYRGISVPQAAELRDGLRQVDTTFRVVKNSLTERAADESGAHTLKPLLTGPTALAFVRGAVAEAAGEAESAVAGEQPQSHAPEPAGETPPAEAEGDEQAPAAAVAAEAEPATAEEQPQSQAPEPAAEAEPAEAEGDEQARAAAAAAEAEPAEPEQQAPPPEAPAVQAVQEQTEPDGGSAQQDDDEADASDAAPTAGAEQKPAKED